MQPNPWRSLAGLAALGLTLIVSACDEDAFTPEDRVFVESDRDVVFERFLLGQKNHQR